MSCCVDPTNRLFNSANIGCFQQGANIPSNLVEMKCWPKKSQKFVGKYENLPLLQGQGFHCTCSRCMEPLDAARRFGGEMKDLFLYIEYTVYSIDVSCMT